MSGDDAGPGEVSHARGVGGPGGAGGAGGRGGAAATKTLPVASQNH